LNKLATRLRIGEKIGLGFGTVGLIFLAVIWFYHTNLNRVVANYQDLGSVYGARQSHAFAIESALGAMQSAAERFLLTRDPAFAESARRKAAALDEESAQLAESDPASEQNARQIRALGEEFIARFNAIVAAWEVKGLNEDAGLQGAFRTAVHELEARAGHYNVDRPYLLLLQIRRREKDLGLRREPQYQQQVHELLQQLTAALETSQLTPDVKQALAADIATYRTELDDYARRVLAGEAIAGGKGPFRDAAHRLEAVLEAHYIPGLETRILQLRRREKDYLLRGDDRYIGMVDEISAGIRAAIAASQVAAAEQAELVALLDAYQRDFHALADQDQRIAKLSAEMYAAAARITPVAEANLSEANRLMRTMSAKIAASSAERARLSLLVAAGATALGALLAFLITTRLVRPLRSMADLLDRLTRENPSERMPADPAGRDEVNAMAMALNTMADHKATFFKWWRTSTQEAIALRDRYQADSPAAHAQACDELNAAAQSKLEQLETIKAQLLLEATRIGAIAEELVADTAHREEGVQLRNMAADMRTLLSVIDNGAESDPLAAPEARA